MSHLGDSFRHRRLERNLTTGQLARLVGYKNLSRGSNRIQAFEAGGNVAPDLLAKLSEALEIDTNEVRQFAAEDYQGWLAWADEPVRPYLVLRWTACAYQRVELPDDALELEAAEAFASRVAVERGLKVALVLSRRLSVYFDARGLAYERREATPDVPCVPYAVFGGRKCQLDFDGGEVLRPIDEPGR
ncbi:helix-turn-helix domain-containing protein [Tautonia plasticadhaerens]|uniref:HTH cro/C1-type domain-containing protein n=1 Tax=Tautonia plasticadhaerens TaxID=2527974 RepID=A0A518H9X7_9BACT|nr:helix-turn-helix transcriptional regulator [Tautonia plasticadhaerens]QDV37546.1 hypothetical protein ElP_54860 [Tautonia plasticadhaerens]